MGEMRSAYDIIIGNSEERDHAEDLGVDGKIILQRILENG
jgi:hypothetical protein